MAPRQARESVPPTRYRDAPSDGEWHRVAERTSASLRESLPALARERGLSIRAIARAVHVNQSHLSRILTGKMTPSGPLAGRIADALGLPTDYFPEYRLWVVLQAMKDDKEALNRIYDQIRRQPSKPGRG